MHTKSRWLSTTHQLVCSTTCVYCTVNYQPHRTYDMAHRRMHACMHARWRITGRADLEESHGTRSVVLESQDPRGVKFIVTAAHKGSTNGETHRAKKAKAGQFFHFESEHVTRYM